MVPTWRNVAIARRKPVGFIGRELCRLDGDPHRLLLKQRHAKRFVQNIAQFILVAVFCEVRDN